MNFRSFTLRASLLAALVVPAAFASNPAMPAPSSAEKEGRQLFREVETIARELHFNASRLHLANQSMQSTRWTHDHYFASMTSLINENLRPTLQRLERLQDQLPTWKRDSVAQVIDSARALAEATNSAILRRNSSGAVPLAMNADFKTHLTSALRHAGDLVAASDAASSYSAAREKALVAGLTVPQP
jgi:hypothetical protein